MRPKNKVTKEEVKAFLPSIAELKSGKHLVNDEEVTFWRSKIDGSYICLEGSEQDASFLISLGITEQVQGIPGQKETAVIGFNPDTQKWFGWSHRAIYGFGIGATCKPGHAHYRPSNQKEYIDSILDWYDDEYVEWVKATEKESDDGKEGVLIEKKYTDEVPNKSLRGKRVEIFAPFPEEYGKGEWVAKTMEDAKQMAIDFARGVS